jgi:hypothetical protein
MAAWLGGLGLIPFVALAASIVTGLPQLPFDARSGLIAYGAVILSFLGGVHWGIALSTDGIRLGAGRTDGGRLLIGVLPSLIGWGGSLLQPSGGLMLLIAGFLLQGLIDLRSSSRGALPTWYPRLRVPLTLIAVASLGAALVAQG